MIVLLCLLCSFGCLLVVYLLNLYDVYRDWFQFWDTILRILLPSEVSKLWLYKLYGVQKHILPPQYKLSPWIMNKINGQCHAYVCFCVEKIYGFRFQSSVVLNCRSIDPLLLAIVVVLVIEIHEALWKSSDWLYSLALILLLRINVPFRIFCQNVNRSRYYTSLCSILRQETIVLSI